jgi:integrase
MSKILTDFAVTNAKKPGEISDGGQRGLRLSVHASGAKSWIVRYRHPITGKSRKLTLPPGLSLAQARKVTSDAMFQVAQGVDPIDAKREQKQAAVIATEGTLQAVAVRYLDIAASKLRSHGFYKGVLERQILPRLGRRPVAELRRAEITALLDKIEKDSGPHAADMALAVLRAMLRWHENRSDDYRSPIVSGMKRTKPSEAVRERALNDHEIRALWQAAGDERLGAIYGQVIRFLLLTGARRSEAEGLCRSEIGIDDETGLTVWRLPARRSKNKRAVVRPLSKAALAIIDNMPIIGESDHVFTLNGIRPASMNHQRMKDLLVEIAGVNDMRVHDLRRVFRSMLSRLRVPFETSEALLGHSRPVLVRTYDQHHPLVEMQEAVEKVAAEIERIVAGEKTGKVIRPAILAKLMN